MTVKNCPLLEKRCQLEKGEEWPYISHVPKININSVLLSSKSQSANVQSGNSFSQSFDPRINIERIFMLCFA